MPDGYAQGQGELCPSSALALLELRLNSSCWSEDLKEKITGDLEAAMDEKNPPTR
jgi:hypothetical protein